MTKKSRLIKNFIALLSLRGLEFLIPLVTLPYLLRTIGIEKFGMIGFGYAFAIYFGAVVQYGFGVTATRDIARNRNDHYEVSHLYSTTLASSLFLALAASSLAITIVVSFQNLRAEWPLHILSLAQVIVQSIFPIWFFQGMERMAYITYLNIGSKIFFIACLFFIVKDPSDYMYVPLLYLISGLLVLGGSMWIIKRKFQVTIKRTGWSAIWENLVTSRHAFVNQLAPNLYNNSATFLLGLFSGSYALGLYTAATKVVDAVSSLAYVLSNTFLPHLSRSIGNHDLFKKIMLSAGLLGTIGLMLGADFISHLLHPTKSSEIASLLAMASVSVFMIFTMLTYGTNYLMLKRKEAIAGRIAVYTSLVFFAIALVIVPAYGAVGGIVTLVGARTCMSIALYVNYRILDKHKQ